MIVGINHPTGIFSPLKPLSTVGSQADSSSLSRDLENEGLLVTFAIHPLLGTGWGVKYIDIDPTLSMYITAFVQYRYLPHNSLLARLAFTGILGFAATWMVFPLGAFFHARAYRTTQNPLIRMAAFVGISEVVIFINQGWGDLGLWGKIPWLIMAASIASAIRLPVFHGPEPSGLMNRSRTAPTTRSR